MEQGERRKAKVGVGIGCGYWRRAQGTEHRVCVGVGWNKEKGERRKAKVGVGFGYVIVGIEFIGIYD